MYRIINRVSYNEINTTLNVAELYRAIYSVYKRYTLCIYDIQCVHTIYSVYIRYTVCIYDKQDIGICIVCFSTSM